MTPISSTPGVATRSLSTRIALLGCVVGGGFLLLDIALIAVLNRSFGTADDVLFLVGFLGMVVGTIGAAVVLSDRSHGAARVGRALGAYVVLAIVIGGLSYAADAVGRRVFPPHLVALHGEWSFFTVGVCLLVLARWIARRGG